MAARPLVTVQLLESDVSTTTIPLPHVMKAPIRADIVNFVHSNISKNSRQPFAVSRNAGHQTSARSWGTGRAISRLPRVRGGGTHRAGQAAFGNMCRGGRMFAPTRIWRKWHRKINVNQRRYAVVSAIAASAVPSLVAARGHVVDSVPEMPLVVSDSVGSLVEKTRHAINVLKQIGAFPDVEKAINSVGIRPGVGKFRNRRYLSRKGPLIVYGGLQGTKFVKAFRNIPGVEVANVDRLNLFKLAPGGHLGRFIIWTKSAFERLNSIYGSFDQICENKNGYVLPRPKMLNADLASTINSEQVQSVVKPINKEVKRAAPKMNPLKRYRYLTYMPEPKIAKKRRPNNPMVSYHPTTYKIADPQLTAAILKLVKQTADNKKLQTGRNRVKSSINRGLSQLVVMAADVDDPVECILPLPSLAEEKDVPYVFVPSKDALGQACGLNLPVFACSVDQKGLKDNLRLMVRSRNKFNRGADQGTLTLPTLTGGRKVLKLVYGTKTHA